MSTASGLRKKRGSAAAAAAAPARAFSLGHGGRSLGRGGGSAVATTRPATGGSNGAATTPSFVVGGSNNSSVFMDGFPFPDGSCEDGFPSSSAWFDAAGGDASSLGSCLF
ncbi:unnamed protein product [Urochloa decumbens]|uniref:Uncharacterized protein n=1 Tax=Urochloa decumbens TaxID=240449 RepID=A0ABC9EP64_9POAL